MFLEVFVEDKSFLLNLPLPRPCLVAQRVKNPPAKAGDRGGEGSVPASGRSPGGGNGNPLRYSCLKKHKDGVAWWASVAKSRT